MWTRREHIYIYIYYDIIYIYVQLHFHNFRKPLTLQLFMDNFFQKYSDVQWQSDDLVLSCVILRIWGRRKTITVNIKENLSILVHMHSIKTILLQTRDRYCCYLVSFTTSNLWDIYERTNILRGKWITISVHNILLHLHRHYRLYINVV